MSMISVIMSVYKEPIDWLEESVNSILNQSYRDFEFIIINDCPGRDDLKNYLKHITEQDDRIVVVENDCNIGLTKSLNKGLSIARGEYIARMDADDVSLPERFSKQVEYMDEHPEVGICGSFVRTFGLKEEEWRYPESHEKVFLFMCSPFVHPAVMIRKSVLVENGICYNENFKYSQDYDFWERLYPLTRFANLTDFLLKYRVNDAQITRKHNDSQLKIASVVRTNAFNTYCRINQIDFRISEHVEEGVIRKYKRLFLNKGFVFDTREVLYYFYRSVTRGYGKVLVYFFCSGDCFRLSFIESVKVAYCLSLGKNKYKVFAAV